MDCRSHREPCLSALAHGTALATKDFGHRKSKPNREHAQT
jgi:hypothetical protein